MKTLALPALVLSLLVTSLIGSSAHALEFTTLKITYGGANDGEWFSRVYSQDSGDPSFYAAYRVQAMSEEVADQLDALRKDGKPVVCEAKVVQVRGGNQTLNTFALRNCK